MPVVAAAAPPVTTQLIAAASPPAIVDAGPLLGAAILESAASPSISLEPAGQKRILCYGDSLTAGFCANGVRFEPYGKALGSALTKAGVPSEVWSCGLCGFTAVEMLNEINAEATHPDVVMQVGKGLARLLDTETVPDIVLIMAGTNDLRQGADVRSTVLAVQELHAACHARGVPTIALAAPLPQRNRQQKFARLLQAWSRTQPMVMAYFDPEEMLPRGRYTRMWEADTLHFTASGSRALGHKLAAAIAPMLGSTAEKPVLAHAGGSSPISRRSTTAAVVAAKQVSTAERAMNKMYAAAKARCIAQARRTAIPVSNLSTDLLDLAKSPKTSFHTAEVISHALQQAATTPQSSPSHAASGAQNRRLSVPRFQETKKVRMTMPRPSSCFAFARTALAARPHQAKMAILVR